MFDFMRKSGPRTPSDALRRALEKDGLPSPAGADSALSVVESRARYAGRKVTFIRVFDAARAAERGLTIKSYADLDAHPDLVLRAGHVEDDGGVSINWRAPSADAVTPVRSDGDRSTHADDERFVFPESFEKPTNVRGS